MYINEFQNLKKSEFLLKKQSPSERISKLKKLGETIIKYRDEIYQALHLDLRRNPQETEIIEIYPLLAEINYSTKHLNAWMNPKKVSNPLSFFGSKAYIISEPKGTVLIIAPWNYPFLLALHPVISALAAGNAILLKPSELAPATSEIIHKILNDIFSKNELLVIQGGKETSEKLLELPFDHIFFTGSTHIGKIIMKAASQHLSSVTLELGGKSPVIVDESIDIEECAEKIIWGKCINAGQTCVAPDYLFLPDNMLEPFIKHSKHALNKFYSNSFQNNSDYPKIINRNHFLRLKDIYEKTISAGARLEIGGEFFENENVISPTLLSKVIPQHPIMSDEIFGPLLPVMTYNSVDEVLLHIQNNSKPLALYIFSNNSHQIENILSQTTSGGACVNDVLIHLGHHEIPFGGVGYSGMGNYHGHFGFKTFSHERALLKSTPFNFTKIISPPYLSKRLKWFQKLP